MSITPPSVESLNQCLVFGVEQGNSALVQWVFTQGQPNNVTTCMNRANDEIKTILMEHLAPRPIIFSIHQGTSYSTLIYDLKNNPSKALADLKSGRVSLTEINYLENWTDCTALMYICSNVDMPEAVQLVSKLIGCGADVNLQNFRHNQTALHCVSRAGKSSNTNKLVQLLLSHPKIQANLCDNFGNTALSWTVYKCGKETDLETVELFLSHPGIDVTLVNNSGNGLFLDIAHCHTPSALVERLLKLPNLDINYPHGGEKKTSLMTLLDLCFRGYGTPNVKNNISLILQDPRTDLSLKNVGMETVLDTVIKACGGPMKAIQILLRDG